MSTDPLMSDVANAKADAKHLAIIYCHRTYNRPMPPSVCPFPGFSLRPRRYTH